MKKLMKSIMMIALAFAMLITVFSLKETKAAGAYTSSMDGKSVLCGDSYLKRTSKGIYSSKSKTGTYKKIVSAKSKSSIGYGFTSDGTYIYYADNNTSKKRGTIYRVDMNGKNKKKIYYAKHMVNVFYYYNNNIVYESDLNNGGSMYKEDGYYAYSTKQKKYYEIAGGTCNCVGISENKVIFGASDYYTDLQNSFPFIVWDVSTHKTLYKGEGFFIHDTNESTVENGIFYYVKVLKSKDLKYTVQAKALDLTTGMETNMSDVFDTTYVYSVYSDYLEYEGEVLTETNSKLTFKSGETTAFLSAEETTPSGYQFSNNGDRVKCGKYYIKRTKGAIYKRTQRTGIWKKVISASTYSTFGNYGFSSNGTYIYYSINNKSMTKGTIYRVKIDGSKKKTIYSAKRALNVIYYNSDTILYLYDSYHDHSLNSEDSYMIYNTISKKTKTVGDGTYDLMKAVDSKVVMIGNIMLNEYVENSNPGLIYDMKTGKTIWEKTCFSLYNNYVVTDGSLYFLDFEPVQDFRNQLDVTVKKVNLTTGEETALTDSFKIANDFYSVSNFTEHSLTYYANINLEDDDEDVIVNLLDETTINF